jgi:hypothetical protein
MGVRWVFNACRRMGSSFIFAAGKDLNAVHLSTSWFHADVQVTLELFLLAQGAQGFKGDVFFGLRLNCRMIADNEIHIETADGAPEARGTPET